MVLSGDHLNIILTNTMYRTIVQTGITPLTPLTVAFDWPHVAASCRSLTSLHTEYHIQELRQLS